MSTTKLVLPDKVRLAFNPDNPNNRAFTEDSILRENWQDDLFRNIWLCYSVQHLRDQYHTQRLRGMVTKLREDGHPRSSAHLAGFIGMLSGIGWLGHSSQHDIEFATLIWPYTNGEKNMPWVFECGRCGGTGEVCYSSTNYGPCRECSIQ
jgi:hypothetical protein